MEVTSKNETISPKIKFMSRMSFANQSNSCAGSVKGKVTTDGEESSNCFSGLKRMKWLMNLNLCLWGQGTHLNTIFTNKQ